MPRALGLSALAVALAGGAVVAQAAAPPVLHGRSAAVLNMTTGQLLWTSSGRTRLPMASTTKLMTALVALQLMDGRTGATMVVPPEVSQAYGEVLFLVPGEHYTFLQLLDGMLLPSANDAAIAVAVDSAGSLPAFVARMNAEAAVLGLTDTHYANPDGLDDPDHYSSADDLARLGLAAMANPVIRGIVDLPYATIPAPSGGGTEVAGNINALIGSYPGADGVKTGYTSEALNVVVGSAQQNGHSVIAVVMGEPQATFWSDEERLLSYGLTLAAAGAGSAAPAAAAPQDLDAITLPGHSALPAATPGAPGGAVAASAPRPAQPAVRRPVGRGLLLGLALAGLGVGALGWTWRRARVASAEVSLDRRSRRLAQLVPPQPR